MKTKKEKPLYTVWQNSAYIVKRALKRDKWALWQLLTQSILAVALATTAIFLPATVVEQITAAAPLRTLVITVLSFTAALTLMHALNSYIGSIMQVRRINLRLSMTLDVLEKVITTDYSNLEEKQFTDSKHKAYENLMGNNTSSEQVYNSFTNLGINILGFVVYIILLAAVNPFIMLVTVVTAILGVLARQWAHKWRYNHDDELAAPGKRILYTRFMGTDPSMAKDIRLFGMVDWINDVFDANLNLTYAFHRKVYGRQFAADIVEAIAAFIREGIAYAYLIWLVLGGGLTVDGFVLLFAAVAGFSGWVTGILNECAELSRHSLNICRIREFYDYPSKFKWAEGEAIAPVKEAEYSLELRNVSFKYEGTDENALENINLTIKPGEKLAVVGLNGAGKTTIVKLLCGLYDPTHGEVLLNGKNIQAYNREDYYSLFTAVFQEFSILPLTIVENLTMEDSAEMDSKLSHCLQIAGLEDKINSLPNGVNSLLLKDVHMDAVEFSGGETQRLMLARALYKDAPILILDEPTAALDPIAENQLYERYNELSSGRTSVYISHRLASTRFCDRIILVDNKTIAEEGTHDTLMAAGGKYAELYDIQSKYYQESA